MHKKPRAGVLGASGYTGQALIRLLQTHPSIELAFATSEGRAGAPLVGTQLRYVAAADAPLGDVDVVFSCLPTGESGHWALAAQQAGSVAIDLSADLRESGTGAVYGLPELWRAETVGARLVANPGCYPTGALLALAPAVRGGLLDRSRPVVINAASGVTGAGRSAKQELLFGEVAEDYRAYGVGNRHRHVPEIARGLARSNGGHAPEFVFTPHLLPVRRGILETIYLPLTRAIGAAEAVEIWSEAYDGECFIEVVEDGLPTLREVVERNVVRIGFAEVESVARPMLLVVAALDNLLKGAAGQALQNANLLLGLPEAEGLPR